VYRDIAFVLASVAAFATAVACVAYSGRVRTDAQSTRIARLEAAVLELEKRADAKLELRSADEPIGSLAEPAASSAVPAREPVTSSEATDADALLGLLAPEHAPAARAQAARRLLAAPDDGVRLYAAQVLLEIDFEEGARAVSSIVDAVRDRPGSLRTATRALALLGRSRDTRADAALRSYLDDGSPLLRVKAAKLLEERGDPGPIGRATEQLLRGLESRDHRERMESLALLGVATQRSALPNILPLLSDESSDIRSRAVQTLARFDDPSLTPTILPLLNDPMPQVRTAVARSLRGDSR
jgi:hypothetical protein